MLTIIKASSSINKGIREHLKMNQIPHILLSHILLEILLYFALFLSFFLSNLQFFLVIMRKSFLLLFLMCFFQKNQNNNSKGEKYKCNFLLSFKSNKGAKFTFVCI